MSHAAPTNVIRGLPMLPPLSATQPDVRSISVTISTTVVLPFVPVIATIGTAIRSAARSISLRTSFPRWRAAIRIGWCGATPGLGTIRSNSPINPSRRSADGVSKTSMPCSVSAARTAVRRSNTGPSSTAATAHPSERSSSATATPVFARPTTSARDALMDHARQ